MSGPLGGRADPPGGSPARGLADGAGEQPVALRPGEIAMPRPGWRWWVDSFEEIIASIAVAVVVLSVSWGVITRYILAQPATWASEIATLGFAWVVFFGAAACFKYKMHPSIEILIERFPPALLTAVRWFNHLILCAFLLFMVWYGTSFAIDSWESPTAVLRWPLTWLYGPVAFCSGLMLWRYLQVLRGRVWTIDADRETNAS